MDSLLLLHRLFLPMVSATTLVDMVLIDEDGTIGTYKLQLDSIKKKEEKLTIKNVIQPAQGCQNSITIPKQMFDLKRR